MATLEPINIQIDPEALRKQVQSVIGESGRPRIFPGVADPHPVGEGARC